MIQPASPSAGPARPETARVAPKNPLQNAGGDRCSVEGARFLRLALEREPAIRPVIVARGRALAADPAYPSPAILRRISAGILAAPDLSEDPS